MKKLMISTVALAVGLGLATSAMAAVAVDTYNFLYTANPVKGNMFEYHVTLGDGFNTHSSFDVTPTSGAGLGLINAGGNGAFSYVIYNIAEKSVAANCRASVKDGVITGPIGGGVIPCTALPLTATLGEPQVWTIHFPNMY